MVSLTPLSLPTPGADTGTHTVQLLLPDWPAPAQVRACFTTRLGGVSSAPWASWNLGDHVHDRPEHVQTNRALLHTALQHLHGAEHPAMAAPVFLQQVHGSAVCSLGTSAPATSTTPAADAALSTQPGTVCTVLVADCLPVLFAHRHAPVVCAAHAGWRGLAGTAGVGVLENSFARFAQAVAQWFAAQGQQPPSPDESASHTLAWLGPCIGPGAFEVGDEVRQAFLAHPAFLSACFQGGAKGKWLADLAGLARARLRHLGVSNLYGNDSSPAWCTFENASLFFSHRRACTLEQSGQTGRMAACIWLQP